MILAFLTRLVGTDDDRLLARVADGDAAALRLLYDRYADRVYGAARRLLDSQSDAEEVVQETFVELWNRAAMFDRQRGAAAAWILTMGRNRAIDLVRRRGVRAKVAEELGRLAPATIAAEPEAQLSAARDRARIALALAALPPEQRAVVELAYFDGLSQSEIAARTGEPLGTIKGRARLALEKLAAQLDKEVA